VTYLSNMDGDLTNVNPELLKLASNPEEWKQKRREALLKVFHGGANSNNASQFLPTDNEQPQSSTGSSGTTGGNEKFVLQQLASMKRRRDVDEQNATATPAPAPLTAPPAPMSLKDRLQQKFSATQ
jgi:hypothetical protein